MLPVVVDTREQLPYEFPADRFSIRRATLSTGDYSVDGRSQFISLERKSLDDFVNTVLYEWDRFAEELKRMSDYPFRVILVEASLDDIARQKYKSKVHPNSVLGRITSIQVGWNTPCFLAGSRQSAVWFAGSWLERAADKTERMILDGRLQSPP